jgi:hypothetical protein
LIGIVRTIKIKTIRAAKVIIVIKAIKQVSKTIKYIKVAILIYIASFKKVRVIKRNYSFINHWYEYPGK